MQIIYAMLGDKGVPQMYFTDKELAEKYESNVKTAASANGIREIQVFELGDFKFE